MEIMDVLMFSTLSSRQEETVYQVFLDLQKAFDLVSLSKMLAIMVAYGIGDRT